VAENSKKSLLKRKRFWLAIIYVGLLIWSGIYRYKTPETPIPQDKKNVLLKTIDGDDKLPEEIRVTYKEFLPEKETDKLPVILLHGSPGSAEVFDGLVKVLDKDRTFIAVDLPGFGDSEKNIPDYSIKAHARYVLELIDKLNIKKAHFVGFSMGGGVALEIAEIEPDRVASISFVSSIGVQEYELLGDYHLNHLIHGVQLAAFWALRELTPHFGIFDGIIPFTKNFYDTDQRPLRSILQKVEMPFLIIHGKDDPLVPVEAAREHSRLVPQSEYIELDDNHFFTFMRPEKLQKPLQDFWNRVESGTAKTRKTADTERIAQADQPFEYKIIPAKGVTALVFFILLIVLTFLSEDLAFLIAGMLAAQGRFDLSFAIIACAVGVFLGGFLSLLIGRYFGETILKITPFRLIFKKSRIEKLSEGLKNKNFQKIFSGRDIMGFRIPVYFSAGILRRGFWKYLLKFFCASTIWAIVLACLSYLTAKGLFRTSFIKPQETYILIVLVLAVNLFIRFTVRFLKK
jgi:pimeloyl-ACP methyl ester carboxylesterase/membrane protein DedA with SNARE-associated domain